MALPYTAAPAAQPSDQAVADLHAELERIRTAPGPVQRLKPYVRPLRVKLAIGWARIWRNKGLVAGMGLFTTAGAQFGTIPGLIVAGVSCIVTDVLTR